MSNSFYVSVKPEIAAAVVKIDANKTAIDSIKNDTGPIRNDVTAIHDTNLPAVKADTGPIRNDVTAIHDTMLPSVKTDTGAIRNDVTAIHDTMLPSVKTDTGAIRNDMTDIHDTDLPAIKIQTTGILNIANAIKAKTDALPQNVRGRYLGANLSTSNAAFQTVLDVTGHGRIILLGVKCRNLADTVEIQVTIDGVLCQNTTHTGDTVTQNIYPSVGDAINSTIVLVKIPYIEPSVCLTNIEFDRSLLVEVRRSAGSNSSVDCRVNYSLDDF